MENFDDFDYRFDWAEPWSVVITVTKDRVDKTVNVPLRRGITNIQLARSCVIEYEDRSCTSGYCRTIRNGWFLRIEYVEEGAAKSLVLTTDDKDKYRELKAFMEQLVCYM